MSHRAFFDALHAAKVRMDDEAARDAITDRDDSEGDELAEREYTDDYKRARGVATLDEPAEVIIRRGRGE